MRINLLLIYKLIMFKIITVGIIMGYNFYKLILLDNKIGYFKMSFLFINLIYKKIIIIIFTYEINVEKSIIEILSRKFMSVTLNIHELKISNLKINIYFNNFNLYNLFIIFSLMKNQFYKLHF